MVLDADHAPAKTPPRTAPRSLVYVVKPGDTLWSIARHFYGTGFQWTRIWNANRSQVADPNQIYGGQRLTIPPPGQPSVPSTQVQSAVPQTRTGNAVTASQLPGVPSTAAYYIEQAAKALGLPATVVAAQNYVESGYGTNMGPSSAGAMGPWQFEPYTWPTYSPVPFSEATDWQVSTLAYISMMKQLLHWSGGNVRMALAAYNAGQGNWQLGLGYAATILSIAHLG